MLTGAIPRVLSGFCRRCGRVHHFDNNAASARTILEGWFMSLSSSPSSSSSASSPLPASSLQAAGGKMLAVLTGHVGADDVVFYAFSGDLLGQADVEGCVPSIIRREHTAALEEETLATITAMTTTMASTPTTSPAYAAAKAARKASSQALMTAMNNAVRLADRRGRLWPLPEVFVGTGIPSGTADCALPKLLHAANLAGVTVTGTAEAWWGPPELGLVQVGERRHGLLAAPCTRRCEPILGALLCDADDA